MNVWMTIPILRTRNRLRNVYMNLGPNRDHEKKSIINKIKPAKQHSTKIAPIKAKSKHNRSIRAKRIQYGERMNSSFNEMDILDREVGLS